MSSRGSSCNYSPPLPSAFLWLHAIFKALISWEKPWKSQSPLICTERLITQALERLDKGLIPRERKVIPNDITYYRFYQTASTLCFTDCPIPFFRFWISISLFTSLLLPKTFHRGKEIDVPLKQIIKSRLFQAAFFFASPIHLCWRINLHSFRGGNGLPPPENNPFPSFLAPSGKFYIFKFTGDFSYSDSYSPSLILNYIFRTSLCYSGYP